MSEGGSARLPVAILAAIALAAAIVYAPVVGHDFIVYDDPQYVLANPPIRLGITSAGVAWAFRSFDNLNWHPLTWISHMLDVQVFGFWAGGHHLTNLLFHVANSLLVCRLFASLGSGVWRAGLAGGLFALHPQHVESVAWISERKDLASAFFGLLALLAHVRHARSPSLARYLVTALCLALGLMCKPMLVTLPAVMLLLDHWPLGRLLGTGRPGLVRCVIEKLPLFALAGIASVLTVIAQSAGAIQSLETMSFASRVANAIVAYGLYLWQTLWPIELAVFYPRPQSWPLLAVLAASALLVAVTAWALARARTRPAAAVGWFWFLGMLVPVIGLVQVGDQALADRYVYLPHLGLFGLVLWSLPDRLPRPALVAGCVLVAGFGGVTAWQVRHWKDSKTLFERALAIGGDSVLVHNNLGVAHWEKRDFARAEHHYRKVIELAPSYTRGRTNLALALIEQDRSSEALRELEEAIRREPANGVALAYLGRVHADAKDHAKALPFFERAVATLPASPEGAEARIGHAGTLAALGRVQEAIDSLTVVLRWGFDSPQARNNLGALHARQRNFGVAAEHFAASLRLKPGDPATIYNLGCARDDIGDLATARAAYAEASRIAPSFAPALRGEAWILATAADARLRDGKRAVALAERASELTQRRDPNVLDALAAALAEVGEFPRAASVADEAVRAARGLRDEGLASRIAQRGEGYRAGKPFRR